MLEKSDHVKVFIDKFYVKTSPTGYISLTSAPIIALM
eukprot:SAG22_NODE_44_length_24912_cov_33.648894_6_plen_37_part_00